MPDGNMAVPSRPPVEVKQVVLPFKEAVLAYQSMPLSKVKQLVLLHQLIYFLTANPYTQSRSWPTDVSKIIKHYMKMFADLSSATLKQVANWFVWLASTLGRFFDERSGKAERNANELRRADHEVHDIADGRYDGRIQKFQQEMSR